MVGIEVIADELDKERIGRGYVGLIGTHFWHPFVARTSSDAVHRDGRNQIGLIW
jgi:hypothetical protein